MCMNRDNQSGLPIELIKCPTGAREASDSCKKARCEYVFIPLRNQNREIHSSDYHFLQTILSIIFLLILLKYIVFFCVGFYNFTSQVCFIY